MGRQKKLKEQRRQERQERQKTAELGINGEQENANPTVESPARRRVVIGAATAGVLVAGGYGISHYNSDSKQDPSQEGYISRSEAKELYSRLKKQVSDSFQAAKAENKPFRIVILENHDSANAFAHEMMLLDIARGLGLRTFLPETGDNRIADYLTLDLGGISNEIARKQAMFKKQLVISATKKGFNNINNIDTRFSNQDEFNAYYQSLTKAIAEQDIIKRFPGSTPNVIINPSQDPNNLLFGFNVTGEFNPPLNKEEQVELGALLTKARLKARAAVSEERNKSMIDEIRKYGDAVVVMGMKHGKEITPRLRSSEGGEIIFSVTDKSLLQAEENNAVMAPGDREAIDWAKSPTNAIQYEGRDFNPENVLTFTEKVISDAKGRGLF